ncbi:MAG: hypothetical protein ACK4IC_09430, partial [Erythrobacter sp.]
MARYDNTGLSESQTAANAVAQVSGLSVNLVVAIYKKRHRQGGKQAAKVFSGALETDDKLVVDGPDGRDGATCTRKAGRR